MGDEKSGNTMQTTNSNTNSMNTSGPNPYIAPGLQNLVNGATGWIDKNMTAPAYFPGGTVAAPTAQTISANTGLAQRGAAGLGYGIDDASRQELLKTISGNYLDPASNPAYQGWLEASFRPQTENLMNTVLPGIDSKFAGSGRTAGGAHFDTTMRGVNDLNRSQADAAAKTGLDLYGRERANQFGALGMLPSFQTMDYQNLAAQAQAGGQVDALNQRNLDAKNAQYSYETTAQPDWYARLSQMLQGMYPGGQTQGTSNTSGTSQGTSTSPGGGIGSILGPALSIAGMGLPFLPGFGKSDRRDKTDIEEMGVDPLTGFKQYAYRYKSDPKTYPKVVGPMAQDIEKVRPDLVRDIGGRKAVAMSALMPAGGLM